ncbi:uncharacterized protein CTRU02_207551 [Colletotrichum truncatum]|uniref:Uncharacterized protein n=1 Tax=Colletotrichum truncatum TaxID=5467 RepID=A0ACC3Z157_COLTU|nr:uncharacterized protein CTRU02_00819 [Colletotrichum truncatum]KAF6800414.1 hypothetical protein CTRU02_00819 [Colletotrichum truncatum]
MALPEFPFAASLSSFVSAARNAALTGVAITQHAVSNADIPAVLAAAGEKTKEFITESVPEATGQVYETCKANPGMMVACGTVGVGVLLVAAPAVVAAPGLAAAGFGAEGVVAGSAAAGVQSGIGSVVAPSLFATLQSAGAGGYGVATVYGAVQGVGGVIASAGAGGFAWSKAKASKE